MESIHKKRQNKYSKPVTGKNRNALLSKIHIAKKQLGFDDETYRDVLKKITGKDSCKAMNIAELVKVLDEMRRIGFQPISPHGEKPRPATSRIAMVDKVEAILADLGLHWNYAHGMAKNMFGVDQCHWLTDESFYKLLQALAVYQKRQQKCPKAN